VDYWTFDLVALVVPAALLLGHRRVPRQLALATAALATVALIWTLPWDAHLVRAGIWAHGEDRVLATVAGVPVEELAFVVLQVVLVAAWGLRIGLLPALAVPPTGGRPLGARLPGRRLPGARVDGALAWAAVALAGAGLAAAGGRLTYLGLLLVWAAPPLALQRAVAGDLLRPRRWIRLLLAAPVALFLSAADRLAIAGGIWDIAPATSTGVLLAGLPLEEALFFALTSLLVADGLLLATDQTALARARALVRRRPAVVPAPASRWPCSQASVVRSPTGQETPVPPMPQ